MESETNTETITDTVLRILADSAIKEISNQKNAWNVNINWEISGTYDETVWLALCMDETTYESLLNSCAVEYEDSSAAGTWYCRITLNDNEKTTVTLKKTIVDDDDTLYEDYSTCFEKPVDADDERAIRLVYEQNGDAEELEWAFTLEADDIEEESVSALVAQWYDEEEEDENEVWKSLESIHIAWEVSEDEAENETESESESESEAESGTESEADSESESEAESETDTETESDIESEIETESGTESETETEAESKIESESESVSESKLETETEESVSESELETETEIETEAETEAENVAESESETESESESKTEDVSETEIETESETEVFYTGVSARLLAATPALANEEESETETSTDSESETEDTTTVSAVDLTDYLTGIVAEVNSETNLISVSLSYSINTSVLQEAGTNIVEYQIPDNISAKKAYSGSVMDGDTVVGTYTISADGLIQIVFNEDYVNGTPADIKGTISFWAKTSEEQVGEDNKMEIVFSDDYSIEVEIDKSLFTDYDVSVDKSCTSTVIDKEAGTVTFTYSIEISTDNGTGTAFNFEDVLSGTHYDLAEYSNLSIVKYSSNGSEVTGFGDTVSIVEGTSTSNPYLSGTLASLEAGEKYVITYTVTRTLDEDDDSITMNNSAKASNTYTADIDYSYNTANLYDLSVTKSSPDSPVLDRESGTITNKYTVTVSTTMGTKGEIDLTDTVSFWPTELDYTTNFKVSSITKYSTDDSGEVTETKLDLTTLDMDADGQLVGTLPELEAGEYYVIEYTLVLSDLPDDELVTFTMMNKVNVSDEFTSKYTYDNDYTNWVGKEYVNWISKTGTYDSSTNTITWKIVLNEGGYGDLDGLALSDILKHNGIYVGEDFTFTLYETKGYVDYPYYDQTLPFTFVNGAECEAWGNYTVTMDTTNQFTLTYTTTVDTSNVTSFFNTYTNTAELSNGNFDTAEVTIPLYTVDKEFTGSSAYDGTEYNGGYVLSWTSSIDIPSGGLAVDSTFTDTISDSSSKQANSKNWFTKSMLEAMTLTIGTSYTLPSSDYTIVCTGTYADGTSFENVELSALADGAKISSFQITFTNGVSGSNGSPLLISYTSYSSSTDLAYNTGTYTEGENSVSDEAAGKGDDGTLVNKYNADGTTTIKTELSSLQDENLNGDPYLLTYKVVVNENNSANGTITITDTLPEGTTLYTGTWKYSVSWDNVLTFTDTTAFLDGIYFYYQPYDTKNYVYPYSNTSETTGRNAYLSSGSYVYGGNALSYTSGGGVSVSYDDSTRTLTITIPEDVYKCTIDSTGEEADYTMVLYYAVKITDTEFSGGYEQSFMNGVTVTTGDNKSDDSSVTNTVVASNVSKTGTYDEGTDTVNYEVYINPLAVTLIEGEQSTLTVKDTFSNAFNSTKWAYYVTDIDLVPGSLTLYKQNDNGKWIACNEEIISSTLSVYNYQAYLTVEVPDGAYYKLTYSYLLTFADWAAELLGNDGTFSVSNSVKVEGLGSLGNSDSTSSEIEEGGSSSTSTKSYANITLYKRDSANATTMLEGAEFVLERYDGVTWETVYNGTSDTFVTDSTGSVELGDALGDGTHLIAYNYLYRIHEVKAPEGYKILSDYMYFYVQDDSSSTIVAPENWEQDYANYMLTVVNNSYVVVENEQKDEGKTEFAVRKVWQDADGNTIENPTDESESEISSITVSLYKTVGNKTSLVKSGITLAKSDGWSCLVSDLPVYENSELIYYFIEEENVPDGWVVSYTNNGNPIAADTDDAQIVVTNISSAGTIPASVNKEWLTADGDEYTYAPEASVDVPLKRSYKIPSSNSGGKNGTGDTVTVTVNIEDKNHSTADGIGATVCTETETAVEGTQVVIYIETPGFNHLEGLTTFTNSAGDSVAVSPSYSWSTAERTDNSGNSIWVSCETLTFYATEDLTVTIGNQWCEYTTDSLNITNNSTVSLETGVTVTDSTFSETVTLSDANNWTYNWSALPQTSAYGTPYTYWIEEIAPSGYYVSNADESGGSKISVTTASDGSISCTVENKRYAGIDTTVTVKKKWQYDDTNHTPISETDAAASLLSSVELSLYRSVMSPAELESEKINNPDLIIPADSELVDSVTISAADSWTYTWEYLDKYYENESNGKPYYYYVVETNTGELYEVSYSGNGANETATTESEAGVSASVEDPVIVTNTVKTAEVTVTKTWIDRNGEVMTTAIPGSVEVQLYRKADGEGENDLAYGDSVILGTEKSAALNNNVTQDGYSEDGWTYTWTNLLQGEYYVVETSMEGFTTTYYVVTDGDGTSTDKGAGLSSSESDADEALTSTSGGTIIVYNQEIPVELTVTKEWGTGVETENVTMQLYRSTTRPSKSIKTVTVYRENTSGTQTLITAKQISGDTVTFAVSSYSWSSAPTLTCDSDQKASVTEGVLSEDNTLKTYTFTVSNLVTDCVLVVHTDDSVSKSSISITGSEGNPSTAEIAEDTGLLSDISDPSGEEAVTTAVASDAEITLSSTSGWTYTWTNLPRTDANGNIYYYYVKETSSSQNGSYVSSYSYSFNEDGSIAGVTVLNSQSLTTSITVQKKWVDANGDEKNLTSWSATLQLYRKNADGEWEFYTLDPTRTISSKDSGTQAVWTNLPAGEYYVEEISMSGTNVSTSSYTVSYSTVYYDSQTADDSKSDPEDASTMGGETETDKADIYLTNTEGSTEIAVVKRWSDSSTNHSSESVTMNLYSSTIDPATAESSSQAEQGTTVTVNYAGDSYENNKFTATGVVLGDAVDVKIYYYYYQVTQMSEDVLTSVYLENQNTFAKTYPDKIVTVGGTSAYFLFSNVDITEGTIFNFTVVTSGQEQYPNTSGHEITDIAGSDYAFNTLINPVDSSVSGNVIQTVDLNSTNKWTYTWTDLPLTDESGNTLYYYVEEKAVENCATTYAYTYNTDGSISRVTVTNRPTSGDTDIKVVKKWTDVNGDELTDVSSDWSVTVQLYTKSSTGTWEAYKDADNQIVTLTLNSGNSWTGTFSNLPNGDYCVKEISMDDSAAAATLVSENYTVYYQIGSQTATEDAESVSVDGDATITITNAETPTSIEVAKVWKDENGNEITDEDALKDLSVQMTLYSSMTAPDVVESGSTVEYTITLMNQHGYNQLAKATINSTSARLYVVYGSLSSSTGYSLALQSGSAVINKVTEDENVDSVVDSYGNTCTCIIFDLTSIQSDCVLWVSPADENVWPNNGGSIIEALTVAATNPVGEYVSVSSALPTSVTTSTATYVDSVKLSFENSWTYSWDTLPTHNSSGKQMYYYIVEGDCAGYTTTYEQYYREDGSVEKVRVTNTYNPNTTEIGVSKNWAVTDESSIANYAVTARLWKHVVDDANAGTYKEVQVSGGADDSGYTVKDLVLTASGSWSGKWTGLAALTDTGEYYYVTELTVTDTTAVSGKEDITNQFLVTYLNNKLSTSGTATITNTEKAEISVTKKWLDSDGTTELTEGYPDSVSVTLRQRVTTTTEGVTTISYVDVETIELGADKKGTSTDTGSYDSTGWTYTWTSLPIGTYCVNESSVEDYTTTYQIGTDATTQYSNGNNAYTTGGNIVITNAKEETAAPTEISIIVAKKWVYEDETDKEVTDADLLPESVTVALYYSTASPNSLTGGAVYPDDLKEYIPDGETEGLTATLTADEKWTCTWSNLPASGTDPVTGGEVTYYYYVKETAVDGSNVNPEEQIYSAKGLSETGTVTVTNKVASTSVSVTKKWLDASGAQLSTSDIPDTWSVDLQLYQWVADNSQTAGGSWETYGEKITLFAESATDTSETVLDRNSTEDWTYTWTHLPSGEYYVEEVSTTASGSFTIGYRTSEMASTEPDLTTPSEAKCTVTAGSSDNDTGAITVVNQKESTEILVEKIWKDSNGTVDTDQDETVTMYLYRTTEPLTEAGTLVITSTVDDATYTSGEATSIAVITCSGELSYFKSVTVDGVTLTKGSDYTLTSGSTIITFAKTYLETLSEGDHPVVLKYDTLGTIETILRVIRPAESETETETETQTEKGTEAVTESETQSETTTETATEAESEKQTEKATETATESEIQTETSQTEPQSEIQTETQTEEDTDVESVTTTMDVTIQVVWIDSNGNSCTAPTEGNDWINILSYTMNEYGYESIVWSPAVTSGNVLGSNDWAVTFTLPASITEDNETTYYKYYIQYGSDITVYDSSGNGTVIGSVESKDIYINGAEGASQTFTITATLLDSSGSQTESETATETDTEEETQSGSEDEESWTVKLVDYNSTALSSASISSSTLTVLVAFDWDAYGTYGSGVIKLECDDEGVTSTYVGQSSKFSINGGWNSSNNYLVFRVTGVSQDCTLTVNPSYAYPTPNFENYIIEGSLSMDEVESTYVTAASLGNTVSSLSASLIINTHTLTTSGEGGTSQTTSKAEIDGLLSSNVTRPYKEITLGSSTGNGLTYTWSDLDKYDENGNLYYYYIVEESVNGYTSSYTTDVTVTTTTSASGQETETITTIDKVTVTNTKDATPISVTVKKDWSGYTAGTPNEYDDYTVSVTLVQVDEQSQSETEIATIELGTAHASAANYDDGGWSYTRTGLDASYSYYFEEVSVKDTSGETVENYMTSYEAVDTETGSSGKSTDTASLATLSQDGVITITNTKKSGQGITLPGTGSKYPLIFYGLGLTFLAVSTTWMLYAFKKKKKKKYKYAGKGGAKPDSS
ncbi:MAG: Cna B-type domain-containing protein [Lachnospiraceae bacterium]|nr:Cna B-type domain-containing protein [Lachnospiraceae bacterium]